MLKSLIKTLGWTLAHTPEPLLHVFSVGLGELIFWGLRKRRRIVLSNLHHAFPERTEVWRRWIGRHSSRRMIETVLLACATPFLSERRLQKILFRSPELTRILSGHRLDPKATLICAVHLAYWEALTLIPLGLDCPLPEFGTLFRPLNNAALNDWTIRTRERFGIRLLSRRDGISEAMKILRRGNLVGLLFDQNAGDQGALTTFLGRVCSSSELSGLWAEKFSARVAGLYPERLGFWRIQVHADVIPHPGDSASVTLELNRWLETKLRTDEQHCASWLWMHNRWRTQDKPEGRLCLRARRTLLDAEMKFRGWAQLPRKTRIFVRLPNWLGDVVMALPLLRALRTSRPDAELTLIGKAAFRPLAEAAGVADHYEALPPRGLGYWLHFRNLRRSYPDVYLLFTNSFRGDCEAWLTRAPQRFGIERPGRSRFKLTHRFTLPVNYDERQHHQLSLWEDFLRHFGLAAPPDCSPLAPVANRDRGPIGLIAGSENLPAKRWPVEHWRALIAALPGQSFVLFGTAADRAITDQIAEGFPVDRVENLAGRTDLTQFAERLRHCRLLVCNDTGGMHLANAWGVPVVGLFGPTNPLRTRPVFNAPVHVLQPPGCPPSGGGSLRELAVEDVLAQVQSLLANPSP